MNVLHQEVNVSSDKEFVSLMIHCPTWRNCHLINPGPRRYQPFFFYFTGQYWLGLSTHIAVFKHQSLSKKVIRFGKQFLYRVTYHE